MKSKSLILGVIVVGLAGCGTWVDTDDKECNDDSVKQAKENILIMAAMGTAYCAAQGQGAFDGEFRCNDNVLQAKCKG